MILFIILVALNVVDAYLTLRVLKQGGRELNPVMAWAMKQIGVTEALIGFKLVMLGALLMVLPQVPDWALWGLLAIYTLVIGHNARQLRKV